MNNEQSSLLTTAQAVSRQLETITATDVPPAFTAARVALKTDLTRIAPLANAQAQPLTGLTRHRDQVFDDGSEAALIVARLLLGFAKRQGLADLEAKVDIATNALSRGRLIRRAQLMRQVHEAASGVAPSDLTALGVTAAQLAELKTKAEAADALKDLPRDAIAARRVITKQLGEVFAGLRSRFRDELDPLMLARRASDPVGYERYQAARIVIKRSGPSSAADASTDAVSASASEINHGSNSTGNPAKLAA